MNTKTAGNYNGSYHFVLKKQVEEYLAGNTDHLTLYKKIGNKIKRVCNGTEAEIDKDEHIIEVYDWEN